MKLIKCGSCGQSINPKRDICPFCGAPVAQGTPPANGWDLQRRAKNAEKYERRFNRSVRATRFRQKFESGAEGVWAIFYLIIMVPSILIVLYIVVRLMLDMP